MKNKKSRHINEKPFHNLVLYAPDGTELSYVGEKQRQFYIKKGLGEPYKDGIKLNFQPGGPGSYFLFKQENKCVVDGRVDNLTKHHVVPARYRKLFPEQNKSRISFELLVMCDTCHWRYERKAMDMDRRLKKQYCSSKTLEQIEIYQEICKLKWKMRKKLGSSHPNAIAKHERIVEEAKRRYEEIKSLLTRENPLEDAFKEIVGGVGGPEKVILFFRHHFFTTMKPMHLPPWWKIDLPTSVKKFEIVR